MGEPVTGCVARVEPTGYHRHFLERAKPDRAMLKLHHAAQLVERGFTAQSWAGDETQMIVTSTINDETLESISWAEERDIIKRFQPDYHIPTDVSVYLSQGIRERVDLITNCMKGAAYMESELSDTNTSIIPLFKGFTAKERELCLKASSLLDVDQVAIYVAPYFSSKQGNNRKQMFRALDQCRDHDMPDVLLVGLLSPSYLERVPEFVVAASGQYQWRKRYSPDEQTQEEIRTSYHQLNRDVATALGIQPTEQARPQRPPEPANGD